MSIRVQNSTSELGLTHFAPNTVDFINEALTEKNLAGTGLFIQFQLFPIQLLFLSP